MFKESQTAVNAYRAANSKGDFREACRIIDHALSQFPDCADLWAFASELYTWRARQSEAHQAVSRAKELAPNSGITWAADAALADFEARFDEALYSIEKAMQIDDCDSWILEKAMSVYHTSSDNMEAAIAIADHWREVCPDDVQAYRQSVTVLLTAGRQSEAEEILLQAEKRFPDEPILSRTKSLSLFRAGKLTEAAKILESAVARLDGNHELWAQYADTLEFCGRPDEAEAAAEKALEICPCAIQAISAMSRICRSRGQEKKAAEWRKRAQEAIPALQLQMKLQSANVALRNCKWNECLKICDEVMMAPARSTKKSALNIKAHVLLMTDRLVEAETVIAQYAALEPESRFSYEFQGTLLRKQGKLQEAKVVLLDGIAHFPDVAGLHVELLHTLHDMGACEEEVKLIDEILELRPQTPYGYVELVTALDETGHEAEARQVRVSGLEMFPNTQELKLFSAIDRLSIGDTKAAKEIASSIEGEWRPLAKMVDKGARKMDWLQRMIDFIKPKRPGNKPPTLN